METYNICRIHNAMYHMQKQTKSSKPKQLYKHFPRIDRIALVYPMISIINNTKKVSPTTGINNWQVNVDAACKKCCRSISFNGQYFGKSICVYK